jgi:hypothetical protein
LRKRKKERKKERKIKQSPGQALRVSRMLKFPDFKIIGS